MIALFHCIENLQLLGGIHLGCVLNIYFTFGRLVLYVQYAVPDSFTTVKKYPNNSHKFSTQIHDNITTI